MPVLAPPTPALDLPPAYRLVALREAADAFAHACAIAADAGAGTFVWARRFHCLDIAVVLEPEEPLASARRALIVCMTALADAVGVHGTPEMSATFAWPDTLVYDGARLGGGRLGWPEGCGEDEIPPWLVFGAMLIASKHGAGDPGLTPESTSLEEEGFETDAPARIAESFSRHLLAAFDALADEGFGPIAARYAAQLASMANERAALEPNGDLLMRGPDGAQRRLALAPALREPAWLDPDTGTPRL
jgi:biotin-(acetyl-CoA carboxylase) ligase